ncbi:MAG: tRNA preQ1(34) S-adenosylmethionine ribosyltransferase-isomerase QueA [Planctomycetota bacterium]|nr:tRNA preQ1(34) S-adenosylmethionine ribosyltransferase-isomerase QueA [Planctomycetota bacterium]
MTDHRSDFLFDLPADLIAQNPLPTRDSSRLMHLPVKRGNLSHHRFRDLPDLLAPGDLLVANDVRVRPARLVGKRSTGGRVECLVLFLDVDGTSEVLLKSGRGPSPGEQLSFEEGHCVATVESSLGKGRWRIRFEAGPDTPALLDAWGRAPLPPYIRRRGEDLVSRGEDSRRYQTIYARGEANAVAAPTAGLHFTPELLGCLQEKGVEWSTLRLDVGEGTFRPVSEEDLDRHKMHRESFELPHATEMAIERARVRGGRVIAVGTTSCRVLETCGVGSGRVKASSGQADLFIRPSYRFRVIDGLITNFHLPGSTLLMLVAALGGRERVLDAYEEATKRSYRFYSYGDAMLLL